MRKTARSDEAADSDAGRGFRNVAKKLSRGGTGDYTVCRSYEEDGTAGLEHLGGEFRQIRRVEAKMKRAQNSTCRKSRDEKASIWSIFVIQLCSFSTFLIRP